MKCMLMIILGAVLVALSFFSFDFFSADDKLDFSTSDVLTGQYLGRDVRQACRFDTSRRGQSVNLNGLSQEAVRDGFKVGIEVGAFDGNDAFQMTQDGLEVISFEPSVINYKRCITNYPPKSHKKLHFVNAAASNKDGFVSFFDDGGTGACIGCNAGRDTSPKATEIRVRSVPLETAVELNGKLGEVGIIKIDTQGHEPLVFAGMMAWLNSSIAPPNIMFEFDVCLMRSAGRSSADIVAFLQSIIDSGYTLSDYSVSDFESKFYALERLIERGAIAKGITIDGDRPTIDAALANDLLLKRVLAEREVMSAERPVGCADLVEWYCPHTRDPKSWRTYTDILASKPRSASKGEGQ